LEASSKRKFLVTLAVGGLLVACCLLVDVYLVRTRRMPTEIPSTAPPLRVRTITVKPQDVVMPIVGYGTAEAMRRSRITAQVAGTIVYRSEQCRAGATVRKDQVLYRIDDRDYRQRVVQLEQLLQADQAQIRQVELERVNWQQQLKTVEREQRIALEEFERVSKLYEDDLAAKTERDAAEAALQRITRQAQDYRHALAATEPKLAAARSLLAQHESELALARLNLERCTVRAPYDGQIVSATAEVGQTVAPGVVLAVLVDPSRIEIPAELPASLRALVRAGATAEVQQTPGSGHVWRGKVTRVSAEISRVNRTFSAYVEVANENAATPLVPGAFVEVRIAGPAFADALLVPRTAIRDGAVFVARDGKACKRPVRVERLIGEAAMITDGLAPAEEVITSNLDVLYDGAPVIVAERSTLAALKPTGLSAE